MRNIMHIRILLIRHAIGMQEIIIIIIIKTWDRPNRIQVEDVTQKQQPFHFKLKKKTFQFVEERGSICFNIIFKPKATFSFDHIFVFMLISFFALKVSHLYKHRIRHENPVSACKPSFGVRDVGLWDRNQICEVLW